MPLPLRIAVLSIVSVGAASAQSFPSKPVSLVVPFAAGGSTDVVARTLGQRLSEIWGQPVIVLNRVGAGGRMGTEFAARAAPDGHTLLFGTTALAINPALYAKMNYDVLVDLVPISKLSTTPNLLAVHPSVPAKTVRELIALARSKPGVLHSASGGTASSNHLGLLLFNTMAGVDIAHVPYKGATAATLDVAGGHVDMTFTPLISGLGLAQSGKVRALAVTSATRSPVLPQVPTISEAGVAGYELSSWVGVLAPRGTARGLVERIHGAALSSLQAPKVKAVMAENGANLIGNSAEEFARELKAEIAKWTKVAQAAGIKLE
ncbi:MAG: tripartite tricarboxylate transporter substrate binding protein [Burkholderiales bacterium]|nr:tripartite tricarboxylate transporter substrate binding protein [Burkholderiales bacterium]